MKKELERQRFREGLFQSLASEGHAIAKCQDLTSRFDQLTDGGMTGEGAANIIYAAYGSSDVKKVCRTIKDWVESELEDFNAIHPGVELSNGVRWKRAVENYNKAIDKISVVFDGKELTREEIQKIKAIIPAMCRPMTTYQASASSDKSRVKNFTIEVTI